MLTRHSLARTLGAGLAAALLGVPAQAQNPTPCRPASASPCRRSAPSTNVGSLPMHMIATPDGKYAVASDMGFRQALSVLRHRRRRRRLPTLDFTDPNQSAPTPPTATSQITTASTTAWPSRPPPTPDGSYTLYAVPGRQCCQSASTGRRERRPDPDRDDRDAEPATSRRAWRLDARGYLYVAVNEYYGGLDARDLTHARPTRHLQHQRAHLPRGAPDTSDRRASPARADPGPRSASVERSLPRTPCRRRPGRRQPGLRLQPARRRGVRLQRHRRPRRADGGFRRPGAAVPRRHRHRRAPGRLLLNRAQTGSTSPTPTATPSPSSTRADNQPPSRDAVLPCGPPGPPTWPARRRPAWPSRLTRAPCTSPWAT